MPRDLNGTQVFDVPPMPPFLPAGIVLAATADRLVIGNTAAVDDVLSNASPRPLSQSEAWKRAARFAPKHSWLTIYVDNHKTVQSLTELARRRDELTAEGPAGMDISSMMLTLMLQGMSTDAAATERLLSHAAPTIYTLSSPPEGLQLTIVQLKPER